MKKWFFILSSLSVFMITACAYSSAVAKDLQNGIVRLHIIAQSDSDFDQSIKLKVRDKVLDAIADKDIADIDSFLATAENAANECLSDNSIPYRARAEFGIFEFPNKTYKNITLPKGSYKSIRIILGDGMGKNWWCVMYPPICISGNQKQAEQELKALLHNDTFEVITKKPTIKFKIVELLSH